MCGRTALALDPQVIIKACCFKTDKGKVSVHTLPKWKNHPQVSGMNAKFEPSANISPKRFCPVIYQPDGTERVIRPMLWSIIPIYHKGPPLSHGLSTFNARSEGLMISRIYSRLLKRNQLCVVAVQGFYEWKKLGDRNVPYFIYSKQSGSESNVTELKSWQEGTFDSKNGWVGPKLLMMAGLYDVWRSPAGEQVYSYTVITTNPDSKLSKIHGRVPVVLETPNQVNAWLHGAELKDLNVFLRILKTPTKLIWYQVSPKMNSGSYQSIDAMKRDDNPKKIKRPRKHSEEIEDEDSSPDSKRRRTK